MRDLDENMSYQLKHLVKGQNVLFIVSFFKWFIFLDVHVKLFCFFLVEFAPNDFNLILAHPIICTEHTELKQISNSSGVNVLKCSCNVQREP